MKYLSAVFLLLMGMSQAVAQGPPTMPTCNNDPCFTATNPGATTATTQGNSVTPTDRSGTITAGTTAQTLMAANTSRHGCLAQNQSNGDLWVNTAGGTATAGQPNIWLPAGAYWECPTSGVPTGAFSIYGATTGQAFAAREW